MDHFTLLFYDMNFVINTVINAPFEYSWTLAIKIQHFDSVFFGKIRNI